MSVEVGQRALRVGRTIRDRVVRLLRSRLAGGPEAPGPSLSVIVPVYNVEEYLAECLESLLAQTLESVEFILVDDGSTDGSRLVIDDFADRDHRFVVLTQPNRGPGAARNLGIAAARGTYVTFLDADDTIPRTAYAQMVATLDRTGSDFVIGAVRRVRAGKRTVPAWTRNVHARERLRTTIDEFPEAMQDVIACNRMLRRDFWNDRIGRFIEGVAYEDHVPMVAAYIRARSFDVLSAFTYNWRIRENATSMGQQKHQLTNLQDRLRAKREAWRLVLEEASEQVQAAWLGRVVNTDLPVFVPAALVAGDDYRAALRSAAAEFLSLSNPDVLQHARADRKLMTALMAAGRWDDVDQLAEFVRLNGILPETVVRGGRVVAKLPFGEDLDLPERTYELSVHQSALVAAVSGVSWDDDRTLHLDGWAYIRGIDLTETVPELEAWLQQLDKDRVLPLAVVPRDSLEATLSAADAHQRYDRSGFALTVPAARLPSSGRWQLRLRVTAAGVVREGAVHTLTRFGTFDRLPSSPAVDGDDPTRIVPALHDSDGFVLETRSDRFRATRLSDEHGRLSGVVTALRPLRSRPTDAVLVDRQGSVDIPIAVDADGRFVFEFTPPAGGRTFGLQIATEDGKRHRVAWPAEGTDAVQTARAVGARWTRSPRGLVQVMTAKPSCRVVAVDVSTALLTLDVIAEELTADDLRRTRLSSLASTVRPLSVEPAAPDRWTLTFPLTTSIWSDAVRPVPSGTYVVTVPAEPAEIPVTVGSGLLARLPGEQLTDTHLVTINRGARSTQLQLRLAPPLRQDERGKVGQRRLADRYRKTVFTPADQVFFQCYRGEVATDHQLAIHRELRRRATSLDLVWGIADRSVPVPDGGRGVVVGSWEWYEALGRSRYLCTNIDFDRFFRRREHQRFLQTFRGHPFKAMGTSLWLSEGYTDRHVADECARRNNAWTQILVPTPEAADIYRREYRYSGEVLVAGSPRNDALISPAADRREAIRRRLGIEPGSTVVLYAPTWREADATSEWSARIFDELDLSRVVDALGPGCTVLLRGHPYNLRDSDPAAARRRGVLDVTRYPEVTDLMIASDVAVLDYSSLRFDWLLTPKPMLFFVPDLEDYLRRRPPLIDFDATAPGPRLRTTEEVVEALGRLDEVAQDHAAARTAARARFNPLDDGSATARVVDAFIGDESMVGTESRSIPG